MKQDLCQTCLKAPHLCVCDSITPISARTKVLILQHPQEPDVELGTAKIAQLSLPNSKLVVGLSWPNLKKAWGEEADPKQWLAIYLGSAKITPKNGEVLICVSRKGTAKEDSKQILKGIRGIVLLDGTWSQAKTIWWRNAWLTKLQRAVLVPPRPSLYGKLRREPKRESLSTLESIGYALAELEHKPEILEQLVVPFRKLLERARLGPSHN